MKKNKNKLLKLLQKKVTKKERGLKQKTFKLEKQKELNWETGINPNLNNSENS